MNVTIATIPTPLSIFGIIEIIAGFEIKLEIIVSMIIEHGESAVIFSKQPQIETINSHYNRSINVYYNRIILINDMYMFCQLYCFC